MTIARILVLELVGRRSELEVFAGALRRALDRRRTVIHVRGAAGIGKSALVAELGRSAEEAGARVVATTVTEAETFIGWAGIAILLHRLHDEVERLPVGQQQPLHAVMVTTSGEPVDPLAVASALAELLRATAARAPLVLVVDDAHWLDAASAGALSFAVRLLDDAPILVVLAARPERMHLDLQRVVEPDDFQIIEPTPLSVAGVRDLVSRTYDAEIGRIDLVRLHGVTGGNPMHVIESARALHDGASLPAALVPATLIDLVDASLGVLRPEHLSVLHLAALMPSPTIDRLQLLERSELVLDALEAAERADLLIVEGQTVRFRHPLMRAGLVAREGTLATRAAHRRLADTAEDSAVRATHLAAAAVAPDPIVADELEVAALSARDRGMLVESSELALRAYELTSIDDDRRSTRRLLAAQTALGCGDTRRSLDLLLPAIDEADGDLLADMLGTIAQAVAVSDGIEECIPWARRRLDVMATDHPRYVNAQITLARALMNVDIAAAVDVSASAIDVANACHPPAVRRLAAETHTAACLLAGDMVDLEPVRRSVRARLERGEPSSNSACELLVWTDQLDLAEAALRWNLDRAESTGDVMAQLDALGQSVDVAQRRGDLSAARAMAERLLGLSSAVNLMVGVVLRSAELALIECLAGRPHDELLNQIERLDTPLSAAESMQLDALAGAVELVAGRFSAAADRLRSAHSIAGRIGYRDLGALPYHANLVEALVAIDDIDAARSVGADVALTAHRSSRGRSTAVAAGVDAMVLAAGGDLAGAAKAVDASIDAYARMGLELEHGRALLFAGVIARRRKQRGRARTLLAEANAVFVAAGAHAFVARCRAELDRVGGVQGGVLSGTEAQIAELAAAGRTNDEIALALFISRRTVESNLTRVYRKLGVRSRTELTARLR